MKAEDGIDLPKHDFRRLRRYLAPWFFLGGDDDDDYDAAKGKTYPPPDDLISEEHWDSVMVLPTDVALKTSSYSGSLLNRLDGLHSDWVFSWPGEGTAPFMEGPCLLAAEEFDALVFNALHGFYRQAIGCLRNAIETMIVAAGFAVTGNTALFEEWSTTGRQIQFGQARAWLRDSPLGKQVDVDSAPNSVFGDAPTSWTKDRYGRLCAYAHSRAGYNNADFWESNGPIYVTKALGVVEEEMRETLALSYLLLRIGWPSYAPAQGERNLLAGPKSSWSQYADLLAKWLLHAEAQGPG
jgi:hypothetical protein